MNNTYNFNRDNYGTFRDSISNVLGIPSGGGTFKKTSKGYAYYLESGDSISYTGLSFDLIDLITECKGIGILRITIGAINNDIVLTDNIWSFEKDTFALTSQTTVTITVTSGFAYVSRIFGFDHSLTTIEETKLQEDFLRNKGTGSSIYKNGFPIKPTDLSHLDGLVFSSNMIPSSGGVLVDTSGNSNNGTINGAISTKNGMKSNTNIGQVSFSTPILDDSTIWTANIRINDYVLGTDIYNFIIGGSTSKNIGLGGTAGEYVFFRDSSTTYNFWNGAGNTVVVTDDELAANNATLSFISNGTNIHLYVNGVDKGYVTPNTTQLYVERVINGYNGNNLGCLIELQDFQIWNRILTIQEIKNYHNQFVKPVILEDFSSEPVFLFPREWIKDSGIHLVYEDTTGNRWLQCNTNGIAKFLYKDTLLGTASIDYYNGSVWVTVTDTLENLISTYAWLSYDGTYLIFTLTSGQRIDNVIINNGIKQF